MKIDKEGYAIIRYTFLVLLIAGGISWLILPPTTVGAIAVLLLLLWLCIVRFFRVPEREIRQCEENIYAPADGTIVVVEKTYEGEYLKEDRIQVSIFMSIWNVHANWFPVGGTVEYFKHHHGRFRVAWHPKSSTENERTTTVVSTPGGPILFRQIAGLIAKRIVSYASIGADVEQNSRCGFIKFGSRVDVFLPLDADIQVRLGDKVTGTQTVIAKLKVPCSAADRTASS